MILSLFNHTCSPNLYKTREGRNYRFNALHDIKKGTELNITYIDLAKNTNQRRHELSDNYGFMCICKRCTEEDELLAADQFKYMCERYGCGGLVVKEFDPKGKTRVCNRCGTRAEEFEED